MAKEAASRNPEESVIGIERGNFYQLFPLAGDLHDDLTSVALLIACRYKTVHRKLRDQIATEIESLRIFCISHRDHGHLIAINDPHLHKGDGARREEDCAVAWRNEKTCPPAPKSVQEKRNGNTCHGETPHAKILLFGG